jgi:hypothetical protein
MLPINDFLSDTVFGGFRFAQTAAAFVLVGNEISFGGLVENDSANTRTIAFRWC